MVSNAKRRVSVRPAFGNIRPAHPICYWDFHDKYHVGGAPLEVIDRSNVWFRANDGNDGIVSRPALALTGAVGFNWDDVVANEHGGFHHDGLTHYFSLDLVAAVLYKPVFDFKDKAVLMWARVSNDLTTGSGNILTVGARNSSSAGIQWRADAGNDRPSLRLQDGDAAVARQTVNSSGQAMTAAVTWYDLAVYIDNRVGVRTVTLFTDGAASTAETISEVPAWEETDTSTNNRLMVGAEVSGGSTYGHFLDGYVKRLGAINYGTTPPTSINAVVESLDESRSEPTWLLHG